MALAAAVRVAVIHEPSRIAVGTPVSRSLSTTSAVMLGSPSARFSWPTVTHLTSATGGTWKGPGIGRK